MHYIRCGGCRRRSTLTSEAFMIGGHRVMVCPRCAEQVRASKDEGWYPPLFIFRLWAWPYYRKRAAAESAVV